MFRYSHKSSGITVTAGGTLQGSYFISGSTDVRTSYASLNNGPVFVENTNNSPILTSERVIFASKSYSEMLGFPASQVSNEYWFPIYDNSALNSQIRVGNLGNQATTISVYLNNGTLLDSFNLNPNEALRKNYAGQNGGPLRIVSSTTNILASVRLLFNTNSYSEELGLPASQLATDYWFPWYNNSAFSSELRVANTGNASASVSVYIGNGVLLDSFNLAIGASIRKSYPAVNNGPLRVVTSSSTILPSIKVLYKSNSYSEMLGLPNAKLTDEYWFPIYDNVSTNSQLRVGNVGNQATTISVYLDNGSLLDSFNLAIGEAVRKNYAAQDGNSLHVVSSTTNVLASLRILYVTPGFESYYEYLAYPHESLSSDYWFPWYNNSAFSTQLRIATAE
jgi:hypothetical protein